MPADVTTRTERLAEEIADAILSGEFEPGAKLDEHGLADRFGVSRTPVREALRLVASTGLIDLRPRRSAIVADASSADLDTLFVAMAEVEATCARLAAMRMTPVERKRLRSFHDGMAPLVDRDDRSAFAEANLTFHNMIYAGAHNDILSDFAAALRRRLGPFRRAQFRTAGRLPQSQAEHATVVRTIQAGDAAGAHAAMFDHMTFVEDSFDRLAAGGA